ncbi:MAG: hypothetical protein SFU53_04320 [Terrimicrobiaceae bacterium]|nr:hypothetical protein [Terrimicrobiaceae bacterium]
MDEGDLPIPPIVTTSELIAENDLVIASGKITLHETEEEPADFHYCDIWRFRDNKMAELTAFVIKDGSS